MKHYVGARYVPKFSNPIEWKSGTAYEALTVVTYNSNSYTSKKPVPSTVGNPADNSEYWALTGNYNAQVEGYRQITLQVQENLNDEITNREEAVSAETTARTNLGNKLNKFQITNTNMVCIGDSWMAGSAYTTGDNRFDRVIANKLGNTIFDYSVGGAGFGVNTTFIDELNNANSKMTNEQKNNTSLVLIVGGINDMLYDFNDANNYAARVSKTAARAHDIFPNALIAMCFNTADRRGVHETWQYIAEAAENNIFINHKTMPVKVLNNPAECIYYFGTCWSPDNIHPNPTGASVFAGTITNWLLGGEVRRTWQLAPIKLGNLFSISDIGATLYATNGWYDITPFKFTFPNPDNLVKGSWQMLTTFGDEVYSKPAFQQINAIIDSANNTVGWLLLQEDTGTFYYFIKNDSKIYLGNHYYVHNGFRWKHGAYKWSDILNK